MYKYARHLILYLPPAFGGWRRLCFHSCMSVHWGGGTPGQYKVPLPPSPPPGQVKGTPSFLPGQYRSTPPLSLLPQPRQTPSSPHRSGPKYAGTSTSLHMYCFYFWKKILQSYARNVSFLILHYKLVLGIKIKNIERNSCQPIG